MLSFATIAAPDEIALAMALPAGAEVLAIERLRYARDEPLALMHNYLPAGLLHVTQAQLTEHGLYALMREAGIRLRLADQTIGARKATASEARRLGESRGAPLLTMQRTAYDHGGVAVEHGVHVYRASLYSFELTLVAR